MAQRMGAAVMEIGGSWWVIVAPLGMALLACLCWRQARVPRCARCRLALTPESEAMINESPPVVETVYRCPRCLRMFEQRVVAAWD